MFPSAPDLASVLVTDIGLVLGLHLLTRLLDPASAQARMLFGLVTAAFLAIYAAWRWHDTVPPYEFTASSLWQHLFLGFELLAISYTLISIIILLKATERSHQADLAQSAMAETGTYPAVDVFICTYDEPLEVLERSIIPALAMDYPNFTVWVLDDTRREWLREYCEAHGARHVIRPDNKAAKAGNLNNGLAVTARQTNAPLILVLDADFAPRRDFLKRTVGLLADDRVALVQTPQFYYNADPIQHNLLATTSWVDDQRFFFDVFQPAKDGWGCAFCVGTSFVVRRDRLIETGGFPHEAISEDINLSYTLLRHGYQTWWLNERLSDGLSAEGVPEYITQRARWCLGTIQVALLRAGPMLGRGFSFTQRWHYFHGVLNWLCKPFMVLLLIAPPIYWFAGVPAFEADYLSFMRYGVPALAAQITYMGWVSRSKTLPLFAEATHAITSFAITATLASALVKPFGRPFKITDKGGDRSQPRVNTKLAIVFGLISLASAVSIVWAFISPNAASEISSLDYFNLLWAAIAMLVAFIAFLVCFELPRHDDLFALGETALLASEQAKFAVQLKALSTRTALVTFSEPLDFQVDDRVRLHLPSTGWIDAVPWQAGRGELRLELRPSDAQRSRLVAKLFGTECCEAVTDRARFSTAVIGLVRRGLRG